MIHYDYNYILSKKHNDLLDKEFITIISKLNNNTNNSNYKFYNNHNNKIDINKKINLELNKLNNSNIGKIYNNIKSSLNNEINIKKFLDILINNSIIQHNNINNYVLLYNYFYEINNSYNYYLIEKFNEVIKNKNKDKIIGSFLFISNLIQKNILTINYYENYLKLIYNENDNELIDILLNSIIKSLNFCIYQLDNNFIIEFKNRINILNKELKNARLRFLCLDIIDIINNINK